VTRSPRGDILAACERKRQHIASAKDKLTSSFCWATCDHMVAPNLRAVNRYGPRCPACLLPAGFGEEGCLLEACSNVGEHDAFSL